MLSMHARRRSAGMSLIELVIAMAIIGIVMAVAIPSYQAWMQNTRIRTVAESILNGMQLARAEAVRRNTNVGFYLMTTLDSSCADSSTDSNWLVSIQDPNGLCDSAVSDAVAPQILQKRSSQEDAAGVVTLTTLPSVPAPATSVIFTPLGRTTNSTSDLTQVDLVATNPVSGSRPLRIVIGAGGTIKMCDPLLTGSDPRRC